MSEGYWICRDCGRTKHMSAIRCVACESRSSPSSYATELERMTMDNDPKSNRIEQLEILVTQLKRELAMLREGITEEDIADTDPFRR